MTRKDYELIAATIRNLPEDTQKDEIAQAFAAALRQTNPRFDPARFRRVATDHTTGGFLVPGGLTSKILAEPLARFMARPHTRQVRR
jgi:hypothetical protein